MINLSIETHMQAEALIYLLEQSIELERLKLQVMHATNSESIESRLKILHGEKFVTLLTVASLS